ncbi:hypothetical protein CEQ90_00985 [Lewinellaceae bacterium SD302]|nr:hypothetical protein CEQ90_00985 [Lewinellaceae bacterium SD302]
MIKYLSLVTAFSLTLIWGNLFSQATTDFLSPEAFLRQVFANNPDALRADLLGEMAAASLLTARGGFDPELYGDYYGKNFKGTDYWDISEAGLYVPTLGGLELLAGYRTASGDFLSTADTQPTRGQAFAGIKAHLLQGLITDERRTSLRRAELLQQWNEIEALAIRNDLGFDAMLVYLDYSYASSELELLRFSRNLAELRLDQTRSAFTAGDRPALDTLETAMQLSQREVDIASARTDLIAAERNANILLWESADPGSVPLSLPPPVDLESLNLYIGSQQPVIDASNNPELLAYNFKLADLDLERRLKKQKVLPKLTVKYEALADGFDFTPKDEEGNSVGDFVLNDNKFEVAFTAPIFQRTARGEVQLNALKIRDSELQRDLKIRSLNQKLQQYQEQLEQTRNQYDLQQGLVNNYRRLLEAEQIKFDLGDSSVFLLNSRENKWLDSRMKLLKTRKELSKIELTLQYLGGNIGSW